MKKSTSVIIGVLVALLGFSVLVNAIYNNDTSKTQIDTDITSETTTSNTITSKTTKTTKKVVKTTRKKTTNKTVKKVKTANLTEYQSYAKSYGNYDDTQMQCLINLWNRESGWNANSVNKSSGACGIPQALPCSKIKNSEGNNDWKAQIRWGVKYINARYKTPCGAWKHFQSKHWY